MPFWVNQVLISFVSMAVMSEWLRLWILSARKFLSGINGVFYECKWRNKTKWLISFSGNLLENAHSQFGGHWTLGHSQFGGHWTVKMGWQTYIFRWWIWWLSGLCRIQVAHLGRLNFARIHPFHGSQWHRLMCQLYLWQITMMATISLSVWCTVCNTK